jgi:hypothetical protein
MASNETEHPIRIYWPDPAAHWWKPCTLGGGPECKHCTPPPELRCLENGGVQPCLILGEHAIHRDGFGRSWYLNDDEDPT